MYIMYAYVYMYNLVPRSAAGGQLQQPDVVEVAAVPLAAEEEGLLSSRQGQQ